MASKTKVEIVSIQFKNGDQWAIGDDTRGGDDRDPVTNIRFERDGYNKQRQVAGPVYVIETDGGFRSIHPADTLECLGVKVTKEETRNTRELPDEVNTTRYLPDDAQVEMTEAESGQDVPPIENYDDLDIDDNNADNHTAAVNTDRKAW